jgi:dipeptidase D
MEIKNLEPKGIWQNFYLLTQIPRPSGHLEKIQAFLLDWAKERNIEAFKDNAGNIIMRKPATPGYEKLKMVTFEGHMDMVPQKAADSTHNFETDPIETYIDGDWVKAKGTTLGSDDGMGVATAMAVFEDNTLEHGPLEAIFTVDEETCMYGVNHLEPGTLKGDILLNLDNETEGEFIIGCAGGMDVAGNMDYQEIDSEEGAIAVKVTLQGLKGGHSGLEISLGRANANKLLGRLLYDAAQEFDADLACWDGGNMRNAIPNRAEAIVTIDSEDKAAFMAFVEEWKQTFTDEYGTIEDDLDLTAEVIELPSKIVPKEIRDNMINAVMACHVGVLRNIPAIPHIVETSCNLGIVKIANGKIETDVLVRSSCESMLDYLANAVSASFSMAGLHISLNGRYPAWQPNNDSPIVSVVEKVYKAVNGEECKVEVVHAGLECGIIQTVNPNMDAISFGPTLRSPHTPFERCNIPSVAKYYKFVLELLKNIPEK